MTPSVLRTASRIVELFRAHLPDLPPVEQVAKLIDEGTKNSQILEALEDTTNRLRDIATDNQALLKRARGAQL
jgi:hypothetical protein